MNTQTIINNGIIEVNKILKYEQGKENDLNNFKAFLDNNKNSFNIDDLNLHNFDLLLCSIQNGCSIELIEFIINNCKKYKTTLNYETKNGDIPLFVAFVNAIPKYKVSGKSFFFIQHYLQIFLTLEKYGAKINFCNRKSENLLTYVYNKNLLTIDIFKFLYNKRINISYFLNWLYTNSTINTALENDNEQENIRIHHRTTFDKYLNEAMVLYRKFIENFILQLIQYSKRKISLSNQQINNLYKENIEDVCIQIPIDYLCHLIDNHQLNIINKLINNNVKLFNNKFTLDFTTYKKISKYIDIFKVESCNNGRQVYNIEDINNFFNENNNEIIDFIFNQGIDINVNPDWDCNTILIDECENCNLDAIKYLVEHGADINKIIGQYDNKSGIYSLIERLKYNENKNNDFSKEKEAIKYLLDHGAYFSKNFNFDLTNELRNNMENLNIKYLIEFKNIKENDIDFYNYLIEYGMNLSEEFKINQTNYSYTKFLIDYYNGDTLKDPGIPIIPYYYSKNIDILKYILIIPNYLRYHPYFCSTLAYISYIMDDIESTKYWINHQSSNINKPTINGNLILIKACTLGDIEMVNYLIQKGADVNKVDKYGNSPLLASCEHQYLKLAKYLIECGADINHPNNNGNTPLHINYSHNCQDFIEYLIDHVKDINILNMKGNTPLHIACCNGNLKTVKYLIKNNANLSIKNYQNNTPLFLSWKNKFLEIADLLIEHEATVCPFENDENGNTPLTFATLYGYSKIVKKLIKNGSDPNQIDNQGQSLLILACSSGNLDIVKYLIELGVDINFISTSGKSALHISCEKGYYETSKYLIEHKAKINLTDRNGYTPFSLACKSGNLEIVKYMINYHVDINQENNVEITPLILACGNGHLELCVYLIKNHAVFINKEKCFESEIKFIINDNEIETFYENFEKLINKYKNDIENELTVNHCLRNNIESIKNIISSGIVINSCIKNGFTPLMVACMNNNLDSVNYLIEKGAEVNITSIYNVTALMIACQKNNFNIVKVLVDHHANLNLQYADIDFCQSHIDKIKIFNTYTNNINGYTALFFAVHQQNLDIIKYLIDHGGDYQIVSEDQSSLLTISAQLNNFELVKYFIDKGINIDHENNINNTALSISLKNENYLMAKYIIDHGATIKPTSPLNNVFLSLAIDHKDFDIIKYLINNGMNIPLCEKSVCLKLLSIFKENNFYLIKDFLKTEDDIDSNQNDDFKIDSDQKSGFINILLQLACKSNDKELVNYLIYNNLNTFQKYILVDSIMWLAYRINDIELLKYLIDNDIDIKGNYYGESGETILMKLCQNSQNEIARYIIKNGIDIDEASSLGTTALMISCEVGNIEMVKYLVENKCNINKRNQIGLSAVDIACLYDYFDIFKYLIEAGAHTDRDHDQYKKSLLMMACECSSIEIIQYIVEHNENSDVINHCDIKNKSILMYACERGDYDIVKYLVDHGADINFISKYGLTALSISCKNGFENIVKLLLDQHCIVNIHGKYGETELIMASKNDYFTIVKYLVEANVDLNATDNSGYTALLRACENDNYDIVNYLIEKGANIHICNDYGYQALLYLCRNSKNKMMIKYCIQNGVDINHQSKKDRYSPLLTACYYEQYEIAKYLIEHGANVNCYDFGRRTPLMIAFRKKNIELSQYLLKNDANLFSYDIDGESALNHCVASNFNEMLDFIINNNLLFNNLTNYNIDEITRACMMDNFKMIKYFIENGININYTSENNQESMINYSCEMCNMKLIKFLLDYGADSNLVDQEGHTPFHNFLLNSNLYINLERKDEILFYDIAKYLIHHEENINMVDEFTQQTALMYACRYRNFKIVKLLIDAGADINIIDNNHNTALTLLLDTNTNTYLNQEVCTSSHNLYNIAKYLIDHGANVNVRTSPHQNSKTPLMLACKINQPQIVQYLIDHGANINEKNDSEETSLIYAFNSYNLEIVKILVENGINISDKDYGNLTSLYNYSNNGNLDILKYLLDRSSNDYQLIFNLLFTLFNNHLLRKYPDVYGLNIYTSKYLYLVEYIIERYYNSDTLIYNNNKKYHLIKNYICQNNNNSKFKNLLKDVFLTLSCQRNHLEIIKFISENEKELNINLKGEDGLTALKTAEENHSVDVIEYIQNHYTKENS